MLGDIDPGGHCFLPQVVGVYLYGRIYDAGV